MNAPPNDHLLAKQAYQSPTSNAGLFLWIIIDEYLATRK
jgi:hypothetical protein